MTRFLLPIVGSVVATVAFAAEPTRESAPAPSVDTIEWQSRNLNLNDLSLEFGQLYGMLLDAMKHGISIETYSYQGATTRSLESIMRTEHLVAGKYFPKEADQFVCELNPSICKVIAKGSERKAKWTNGPADEIRLPKLTFDPVIVPRDYPKKAIDKLASIVVNDRGGCEKYDDACRKYVGNLNRMSMDKLEGRYEGLVLVPTLAYRTRITLTNHPIAANSPAPDQRTSTMQKVLQNHPDTTRSIVPKVNIRIQAVDADASDEGTRQRIFDLISHPFARKASIPTGPIQIGVFDTWLDASHCDIASAITSYIDQGEMPPGAELSRPCGARGTFSAPFDHGTHVVGLLAGSQTSKSGPGVNPNARIYFVRINPQEIRSDDSVYLNHISMRLHTSYKDNRLEVVNLSFDYPFPQGRNDTFLSAIGDYSRKTLFVAAAGNDNEELRAGGICSVRPACAGKANLITVAALDLSVDKPALISSNYGSAVHIAAPGKNVMSAISGGRIGTSDGTSQAAPLVAGAASLLLLKGSMHPETVKNRLIYTSDLFPSLYEKVLGGRLNVTRALAYESAQLLLKSGQSLQGLVGNLGQAVALFNTENGEKMYPLWSKIRRLKYDKNAGYYTMFWMPGNGEPLRRSFVTPQNSVQKLKLKSEQTTPTLKIYTLDEIDDYVAAIPQDPQ